MMKRLIVAAVVLAIAAAAAFFYTRSGRNDDATYVTEKISRGDIVASVTATGSLQAVTTVQVGTYVSGPVIAVDVDYNSPVRKGQRVAKIDPASFNVKVQRAAANVANARARLDKAKSDLELKRLLLERFQGLRSKQFVSQNDVDTARSNWEQARAQVALEQAGIQQSEADLREAEINLGYTDIQSPVDGVVVSRSVNVGQTVAASFQTPTLFEIAQDLTQMQVNASVSESDIGVIETGQSASFTVDAFPERTFDGKIVQVRNAPITVQNVVTYDVVIQVNNSSLALRPGMTATVTIVTARRTDVLRVPIRALGFHPPESDAGRSPKKPSATDTGVWRQRGDQPLERVGITPGLRDDRHVEVVSDELNVGDDVVVALKQPEGKRDTARPPGFPRMR